jgi:hypothetical protein
MTIKLQRMNAVPLFEQEKKYGKKCKLTFAVTLCYFRKMRIKKASIQTSSFIEFTSNFSTLPGICRPYNSTAILFNDFFLLQNFFSSVPPYENRLFIINLSPFSVFNYNH